MTYLKKSSFKVQTLLLMWLLASLVVACGDSNTATATSTSTSSPTSTKISIQKLTLGSIPAENAEKTTKDTRPFADALSKELGIPVDIAVGKNYSESLEFMRTNKTDVAWLGPFTYLLASSKGYADAMVVQLNLDGTSTYNSVIIAKPNSGIKTIADLKGKTFSFVDANSTSGNIIPRYMMTKNGLDPDKDVQGSFAGGHDASAQAVVQGKVQAGAVANFILDKMIREGTIKESDFVVIAKSDNIPNVPIAISTKISASDREIIKKAFIKIRDASALTAFNTAGFQEVSDKDYDGLREVVKTMKLDLSKIN
jgi:phosphonate transport system substrate-binding protein